MADRNENIKDSILSLYAQTEQDFSVTICTDTGASDKVKKYLNLYDSKFRSRIRIIEEKNNRSKKLISLINNSIEDYIIFLDDDDHVTHNFVSAFNDIEDTDMKVTKSVRRNYNYPVSLSDIEVPFKSTPSPINQFFENNWPICSIAFKLSKLRQIQIDPSIEFLEDWAIITKMLEEGNKFVIGNNYTFIYNFYGFSKKKIEFDKSRSKNFSKKATINKLERYIKNISTQQFIQELVDTGFSWVERENLLGEAGDAYRRESEIHKKNKEDLQDEKLYKILYAIRKIKNSLIKLIRFR